MTKPAPHIGSQTGLRPIRQARPPPIAKYPSFIFPGLRPGRPLSNMVFAMAIRRRGFNVTAHGFRSAFADWRGDATTFPNEFAEAALAYTIGDKVEAAYRRSDALERRRELMDAWSRFIDGENQEAKIVHLGNRISWR
jgi:hypothetical protein